MLVEDKRGNLKVVSSFSELGVEPSDENPLDKNKKWRSFDSLQAACADILGRPLPPSPSGKAPEIKVGELEDVEADAEIAVQMAEFCEENLLPWIFGVYPWMQKVRDRSSRPGGERFLDMPYKGAEKPKTYREQLAEVEKEMDSWLKHQDPMYGQYAEFGEAMARINVAENQDQLINALGELLDKGILVEAKNGAIRPFATISLDVESARFRYVDSAPARLGEAVKSRAQKIKGRFFETVQQKENALREQASHSVLEALKNKQGICAMAVDQGVILVSASQEGLRIMDAAGRPVNGFLTMKQLEQNFLADSDWKPEKVFLPAAVSGISWLYIEDNKGELVSENYRLPKELLFAPSQVKDVSTKKSWFNSKALAWKLLWQGFHNALAELKALESVQAWKELVSQITSSDPKDLHVTRRPGRYLVGHREWHHKGPEKEFRVNDPAILVKIFKDKEGNAKIRIGATTPDCEEMFADCLGEHFLKDKYEGLPNPLGNFLRAHFAATVAARNGNKR